MYDINNKNKVYIVTGCYVPIIRYGRLHQRDLCIADGGYHIQK